MNVNNTTEYKLPRMRAIPKAYEEIKALDPETSLSMRGLRKLVGSGQIPTVKIANKVLINLDLLIDWLACYNTSTVGA